MKTFHFFSAILFLVVGNGTAVAAQIRELEGYLVPTIEISGEIEHGDLQSFAKLALEAKGLRNIVLSSPGGDVIEAIRIGELVRSLRLLTLVDNRGPCSSACFFIWLNGQYRVSWNNKGKIGIHRPYFISLDNDDNSIKSQANLMKYTRAYLEERQIPRRIIDLMMSLPSSKIYWLSSSDLQEIGKEPFELQELYVSKCGDSVGDKYNPNEMEAWLERLERRAKCIDDINAQARKSALDRLKFGRFPPDPMPQK
jgi:hypothetical protein